MAFADTHLAALGDAAVKRGSAWWPDPGVAGFGEVTTTCTVTVLERARVRVAALEHELRGYERRGLEERAQLVRDELAAARSALVAAEGAP